MKNLKTYIVSLFLMIATISFAQKITIDTKNATTFLVVKDVKIALKQQVFLKIANKGNVNYKLNDDVPNVISNVQKNLKFLFINEKNANLDIKIIKLNKDKSIDQDITSFNSIKNEINFETQKTKTDYTITIPKIEKGIYAIIVNNSTTCNVFEIN